MWNLKKKKGVQMNLSTKQKQFTEVENKLMLNKRKGGEVIDWGTGRDIYTLL